MIEYECHQKIAELQVDMHSKVSEFKIMLSNEEEHFLRQCPYSGPTQKDDLQLEWHSSQDFEVLFKNEPFSH
jgi:hypothetical protein